MGGGGQGWNVLGGPLECNWGWGDKNPPNYFNGGTPKSQRPPKNKGGAPKILCSDLGGGTHTPKFGGGGAHTIDPLLGVTPHFGGPPHFFGGVGEPRVTPNSLHEGGWGGVNPTSPPPNFWGALGCGHPQIFILGGGEHIGGVTPNLQGDTPNLKGGHPNFGGGATHLFKGATPILGGEPLIIRGVILGCKGGGEYWGTGVNGEVETH